MGATTPEAGSLSSNSHYRQMWQQYSFGLEVANQVDLDRQVAHRALKAGCARKDIGLMLVSGSFMVRDIAQNEGKDKARRYVNWLVRKIYAEQQQQRPSPRQQHKHQWELGD